MDFNLANFDITFIDYFEINLPIIKNGSSLTSQLIKEILFLFFFHKKDNENSETNEILVPYS